LTINALFLKKLLVAFVVGFAGSIVQAIVNVGPVADLNVWKAVWVSALTGAVVAGFRAILVLLPINLVPSDKQPVLTRAPAASGAQAGPKPAAHAPVKPAVAKRIRKR
jgi:hypothetical protein